MEHNHKLCIPHGNHRGLLAVWRGAYRNTVGSAIRCTLCGNSWDRKGFSLHCESRSLGRRIAFRPESPHRVVEGGRWLRGGVGRLEAAVGGAQDSSFGRLRPPSPPARRSIVVTSAGSAVRVALGPPRLTPERGHADRPRLRRPDLEVSGRVGARRGAPEARRTAGTAPTPGRSRTGSPLETPPYPAARGEMRRTAPGARSAHETRHLERTLFFSSQRRAFGARWGVPPLSPPPSHAAHRASKHATLPRSPGPPGFAGLAARSPAPLQGKPEQLSLAKG